MTYKFLESKPAPKNLVGPVAWIKKNLFSNVGNSILTVASFILSLVVIITFLNFFLFDAVFTGDKTVCGEAKGICYSFIINYMSFSLIGTYDNAERYRPYFVFILFLAPLIYAGWPSYVKFRTQAILFLIFIFPVIAFIILLGNEGSSLNNNFSSIITMSLIAIVSFVVAKTGKIKITNLQIVTIAASYLAVVFLFTDINFGLPEVPTHKWGGLLVTLVIAVIGIALSLPLGLILALGRRSNLPIFKIFSTVFIEFWRGVPLITVLFMADVMIPIFMPPDVTIDGLLRVLIGVTLFASAYMAEVIRGGLQSIVKGQYEGANSLGLSYFQSMVFIIIPQSLKVVIPGIVNTFIGLFKDTTLVSIVGIKDLLGVMQGSLTNPAWSFHGQALSAYAYVAIIFFIFCFSMSKYSIFLENKLNTEHR